MARVEYFFDYGSPTSYLGWQLVKGLESRRGVEVSLKPFSLGHVVRDMGVPLPDKTPLLGAYTRRDVARWADRLRVPFVLPASYPCRSLEALRGFFVAEEAGWERAYMDAAFDAHWVEGRDLHEETTLRLVARRALGAPHRAGPLSGGQGATAGLLATGVVGGAHERPPGAAVGAGDAAGVEREFLARIASPEIKGRLTAHTTEAIRRGVCGAPFTFLDGEPFLGIDRLDWMERELARRSAGATGRSRPSGARR